MIPHVSAGTAPTGAATEHDPHAIVLAKDATSRHAITSQLRDAGYLVTSAATFGAVELLLADLDGFDVLVTAQSFGEMSQFGLPQLARAARPDLPIVVLEQESVLGEGVISAVHAAVDRWPLRDRQRGCLH